MPSCSALLVILTRSGNIRLTSHQRRSTLASGLRQTVFAVLRFEEEEEEEDPSCPIFDRYSRGLPPHLIAFVCQPSLLLQVYFHKSGAASLVDGRETVVLNWGKYFENPDAPRIPRGAQATQSNFSSTEERTHWKSDIAYIKPDHHHCSALLPPHLSTLIQCTKISWLLDNNDCDLTRIVPMVEPTASLSNKFGIGNHAIYIANMVRSKVQYVQGGPLHGKSWIAPQDANHWLTGSIA